MNRKGTDMFYGHTDKPREIFGFFLIARDECDRLHIFRLSELRSIIYFSLRNSEYDRSIFSIESCTQEFTHERSDLLRWEVHDSYDLLSDELFSSIVSRDLCT